MKALSILVCMILCTVPTLSFASGGGGGSSNYIPLDPPFVVNILGDQNARFLQVTAEIKVSSPDLAGEIKHHSAPIRHALLMLLSAQKPDQIRSLEDKERLRDEALNAIKTSLEDVQSDPEIVENVYFTGFVIQ